MAYAVLVVALFGGSTGAPLPLELSWSFLRLVLASPKFSEVVSSSHPLFLFNLEPEDLFSNSLRRSNGMKCFLQAYQALGVPYQILVLSERPLDEGRKDTVGNQLKRFTTKPDLDAAFQVVSQVYQNGRVDPSAPLSGETYGSFSCSCSSCSCSSSSSSSSSSCSSSSSSSCSSSSSSSCSSSSSSRWCWAGASSAAAARPTREGRAACPPTSPSSSARWAAC
ncbi:supporter of activation of yellow protein isoform X2 [Balamuthia mandrillaris]